MPPIQNIFGAVCILFVMFFFPIMHGLARLLCYVVSSKAVKPHQLT